MQNTSYYSFDFFKVRVLTTSQTEIRQSSNLLIALLKYDFKDSISEFVKLNTELCRYQATTIIFLLVF